MKELEVLFTAVGSIGARHLKNLSELCGERGIVLKADVCRKTSRMLPGDLRPLVRCEVRDGVGLAERYDIAFITSETALHYANIASLKGRVEHMFIEKPLFECVDHDLSDVLPADESIYYVAAPIRFSRYFDELSREVKSRVVRSARIIFSSYMPSWQKGRDYRQSFRTKEALGGGVDIDSLHEIDYMTALFGFPESVHRVAGKYSSLEMDACDLATYLFCYPDKAIEMHLDYFGRVPNRRTELFCDDEVVVCDFNKKTTLHQLSGKVRSFGPDDRFYQSEMSYFLDLVLGETEENINPMERAYRNLSLAKGAIVGLKEDW